MSNVKLQTLCLVRGLLRGCFALLRDYAKKKEDHDYDLLKALGCQQYWVRTTVPPGSPGWSVVEVIEEVTIP